MLADVIEQRKTITLVNGAQANGTKLISIGAYRHAFDDISNKYYSSILKLCVVLEELNRDMESEYNIRSLLGFH